VGGHLILQEAAMQIDASQFLAKSDEELKGIYRQQLDYNSDVIKAVVAELTKRGIPLPRIRLGKYYLEMSHSEKMENDRNYTIVINSNVRLKSLIAIAIGLAIVGVGLIAMDQIPGLVVLPIGGLVVFFLGIYQAITGRPVKYLNSLFGSENINESLKAIVAELHQEAETKRISATIRLAAVAEKSPAARDLLLQTLEDPSVKVRTNSVLAMKRSPSTLKSAIPAIVELLSDPFSVDLREDAVRALTEATGQKFGDDVVAWNSWLRSKARR
jgi:hypothetical protein